MPKKLSAVEVEAVVRPPHVAETPNGERRCDCLEEHCHLCQLDKIDFEAAVREIIQAMGAQKVDF